MISVEEPHVQRAGGHIAHRPWSSPAIDLVGRSLRETLAPLDLGEECAFHVVA